MTRVTYYGLIASGVAVPLSGLLIAARANPIADVLIALLGIAIILESLALVTNWRGGTDSVVSRLRKTQGSVLGYFRTWGLRIMAIPLLFIGILLLGASINYLLSSG
jgi:hypothetical protein